MGLTRIGPTEIGKQHRLMCHCGAVVLELNCLMVSLIQGDAIAHSAAVVARLQRVYQKMDFAL